MQNNTNDNVCVNCTCNKACHCAEATLTTEHDSFPCPQCDCGDCQCKNMYKRTGWGKSTVRME